MSEVAQAGCSRGSCGGNGEAPGDEARSDGEARREEAAATVVRGAGQPMVRRVGRRVTARGAERLVVATASNAGKPSSVREKRATERLWLNRARPNLSV